MARLYWIDRIGENQSWVGAHPGRNTVKTCEFRDAEGMAYQIFDSTFARPFTRTSTIARLK